MSVTEQVRWRRARKFFTVGDKRIRGTTHLLIPAPHLCRRHVGKLPVVPIDNLAQTKSPRRTTISAQKARTMFEKELRAFAIGSFGLEEEASGVIPIRPNPQQRKTAWHRSTVPLSSRAARSAVRDLLFLPSRRLLQLIQDRPHRNSQPIRPIQQLVMDLQQALFDQVRPQQDASFLLAWRHELRVLCRFQVSL